MSFLINKILLNWITSFLFFGVFKNNFEIHIVLGNYGKIEIRKSSKVALQLLEATRKHRSFPLTTEDTFFDPKWMPENTNSTNPINSGGFSIYTNL